MASARANVFALLKDDAEEADEASIDKEALSKVVKKRVAPNTPDATGKIRGGKGSSIEKGVDRKDRNREGDEWGDSGEGRKRLGAGSSGRGNYGGNFAVQQRDSFRSRERGGGRGGGRGRGRDYSYGREYPRDNARFQAYPPRGREFDRRSGTGRGRELNKGGGGKHAFGSEKDDAREAEDAANWGFQSGGGEWGAIEAVEMVASGDNWNSVNDEAQEIRPVSWDTSAADDVAVDEKDEAADAKEDNQDIAPGWGVSNGTSPADKDAREAESSEDVQWKREKSMTYDEYLAHLAEKREELGAALSSSKGVRKPNEGNKAFAKMSVLKKKIEADSDTSILGAVTMKEVHTKKTMVDSTLSAVRNNLDTQKFFHEHGGGTNRYRDRDRRGGRGRGGDSRREYSAPRNEMGGFGNRATQAPNMDDTVAFPSLGA